MSCSPLDSSAMLHLCFHTNSLSRPEKHFSPHSHPDLKRVVTSDRLVSRWGEGGVELFVHDYPLLVTVMLLLFLPSCQFQAFSLQFELKVYPFDLPWLY